MFTHSHLIWNLRYFNHITNLEPEFHHKQVASMINARNLILFTALAFWLSPVSGPAQEVATKSQPYETKSDIAYYPKGTSDAYQNDRCRLDVYFPTGVKNYPTVVWFHGGGLTNGEKSIPAGLKNKGIAVVAVNYRFSPKVKSPAYIEDAAAAVAWTFQNIETFGGSKDRIFVSGHSAGGYLAAMVGLDKRWMAKHDIDANRIAGLIPYSGHMIDHYTVRAERGIPDTRAIVDELAPLYHVRKDSPPMLLITGDRELEMLGRYEENAYMWRMMKVAGHKTTELFELDGYNHGQMAEPAHPLMLRFIQKTVKQGL
jgi:acetyl esterase/lipase